MIYEAHQVLDQGLLQLLVDHARLAGYIYTLQQGIDDGYAEQLRGGVVAVFVAKVPQYLEVFGLQGWQLHGLAVHGVAIRLMAAAVVYKLYEPRQAVHIKYRQLIAKYVQRILLALAQGIEGSGKGLEKGSEVVLLLIKQLLLKAGYIRKTVVKEDVVYGHIEVVAQHLDLVKFQGRLAVDAFVSRAFFYLEDVTYVVYERIRSLGEVIFDVLKKQLLSIHLCFVLMVM